MTYLGCIPALLLLLPACVLDKSLDDPNDPITTGPTSGSTGAGATGGSASTTTGLPTSSSSDTPTSETTAPAEPDTSSTTASTSTTAAPEPDTSSTTASTSTTAAPGSETSDASTTPDPGTSTGDDGCALDLTVTLTVDLDPCKSELVLVATIHNVGTVDVAPAGVDVTYYEGTDNSGIKLVSKPTVEPLPPGGSTEVVFKVPAPGEPGDYFVEVSPLDECDLDNNTAFITDVACPE